MQPVQSQDERHVIAREKRIARQELREELIAQFFEEVDSNKIKTFVKEESFISFVTAIRNNALLIQKRLKSHGTGHLEFTSFFPFEMFCAFVSQFDFNRSADVKFRCKKDGNYSVEILISKREDVDLLLGGESLATVENTQVLCSDIYPTKLKYFKSHNTLKIGIDYETRKEKLNEETNQIFLGHFKPAQHLRKLKKRTSELENRKRKNDDEFIDNNNILQLATDEWFAFNNHHHNEISGESRKRKKSAKLFEPQYEVSEILGVDYCEVEEMVMFNTLWSNGEKSWEPINSFIDKENDEEITCKALQRFCDDHI